MSKSRNQDVVLEAYDSCRRAENECLLGIAHLGEQGTITFS